MTSHHIETYLNTVYIAYSTSDLHARKNGVPGRSSISKTSFLSLWDFIFWNFIFCNFWIFLGLDFGENPNIVSISLPICYLFGRKKLKVSLESLNTKKSKFFYWIFFAWKPLMKPRWQRSHSKILILFLVICSARLNGLASVYYRKCWNLWKFTNRKIFLKFFLNTGQTALIESYFQTCSVEEKFSKSVRICYFFHKSL